VNFVTECPVFDKERAKMLRKLKESWNEKREDRAREACRERKNSGQEENIQDTHALFAFLLNEGHAAVDEFLGKAAFRRRVFEESPGRYGAGSPLDETVSAEA